MKSGHIWLCYFRSHWLELKSLRKFYYTQISIYILHETWNWGNEKWTNSFLFLPIIFDSILVTSPRPMKHVQNRWLICVVFKCKIQFSLIFNREFSFESLPQRIEDLQINANQRELCRWKVSPKSVMSRLLFLFVWKLLNARCLSFDLRLFSSHPKNVQLMEIRV